MWKSLECKLDRQVGDTRAREVTDLQRTCHCNVNWVYRPDRPKLIDSAGADWFQ